MMDEEKDKHPSTIIEAPSSVESYSSKHNSTEYNNMRGYDPTSEDDMDDNGMSRYMENNDEEGWD